MRDWKGLHLACEGHRVASRGVAVLDPVRVADGGLCHLHTGQVALRAASLEDSPGVRHDTQTRRHTRHTNTLTQITHTHDTRTLTQTTHTHIHT
jgi:hypothetical protein